MATAVINMYKHLCDAQLKKIKKLKKENNELKKQLQKYETNN